MEAVPFAWSRMVHAWPLDALSAALGGPKRQDASRRIDGLLSC